ncbi:MAG TPA: PHP domain-containing protein [Acidimicrobiales bacterium]|nr:PHP domain-containing protein [Acidimicrobiales bacterium]
MIDLHTHSTVSDGTDPPAGVVDLAAAAGCSAVALTDHDRLDGLPAAAARAASLGLRLVAGCEVSCRWERGNLHLLVYFVEPGEGPFQDALVELQRGREERNIAMAAALGLDYEELLAEAGGDGVGRPHAAALLVRHGRAATIDDAFRQWLVRGRPGDIPRRVFSPARAVAAARASGGVAVLAHPLSTRLEPDALASALRELAGVGLGGVEALYGRYSVEERGLLEAMAVDAGLAVTGGSDHHGTYKPDLAVGVGRGDLDVPDHLLDALEDRRPG